jgi:hypothetical protein
MAVKVYKFEVRHVVAPFWVNMVLLDLFVVEEIVAATQAQTFLTFGNFLPFPVPRVKVLDFGPVPALPVCLEAGIIGG